MKEIIWIQAPKVDLSNEEITNPIICRVQNTGNQDAHRNGWVWLQKTGKSEGYAKENIQGTTSEGKETGTQTNGLDQKEERDIQPEQNEETRIQKNEERLRKLWENFKHSCIQIIGVSEGEEEEQEIENLFEQIMKKNSPIWQRT